jgi:hypothetical protein
VKLKGRQGLIAALRALLPGKIELPSPDKAAPVPQPPVKGG